MAIPEKDDHIEELLSKLQGIFGKLSHSEEEEPGREDSAPAAAPAEPAAKETMAPPPVKLDLQTPVMSPPPAPAPPPEPVPPPAPEPADVPMPAPVAEPPPVPDPLPVPAAPQAPAMLPANLYETSVPLQDPDKLIIPAAVYFPPGKDAEAKSLAQKLEIMTPKFTKVAFRLRVGVFLPYDPRSEWKETIRAKAAETKFQAVFVIIDRPLDDAKRKLIAAELEGLGVYFHDVLIPSIEKKAFYTDVLLGLVFFFDSRKPSGASQESTT